MTEITRRLYRSRSNRMAAGVLGGLAEYFSVDPTIVRVVYVAASVVSAAFPGIILYALAWALILHALSIPADGEEKRRST